jgi:hypothetical protein
MKSLLLKTFLLAIVLMFPISIRPTWVGFIATPQVPHIAAASALAGGIVAGIYVTGNEIDENMLVEKWSQTMYGKWFLNAIGAYNNPKRALYAYRLCTILCGSLAGAGLGYGIGHFFSSARATSMSEKLFDHIKEHPLSETGFRQLTSEQIIDKTNSRTEFPLHDASGEISNLACQAEKVRTMCDNVAKNSNALPLEKSKCNAISNKIPTIQKTLNAAQKTVLKDPNFQKENNAIAQKNMAQAQHDMVWEKARRNNIEMQKLMNKKERPQANITISVRR